MSENFRSRVRSERGSTLVEFGIVSILMLMMLFGIIDFGRALYTYHFVANAAREGTRYAIVRGATCQPPMTDCDVDSGGIQTYLQGLATGIGLNPSQLSAAAQWPGTSGSTNSNVNCSPANNPGCIVLVQVSYPFQFSFPLLPVRSYSMTSTSQMVISQ